MEQRLSHAYMLIGPDGEGREQSVKRLAASLLCTEANAPCGQCRDCRKVSAGIHPDMIVVERQTDDKGKLRQNLLVDENKVLL